MASAPESMRPGACDPPSGRFAARAVPLVLLFFCSGSVALVYEMIWQRQFALVFGSAAPATAAVLAAYFAGLAAGSRLFGRRTGRPLRRYAALEGGIGLGALLVLPALKGFEALHPWLSARLPESPGSVFLIKTLLVFCSLALPTLCMGGTLPVLAELVDRGERRLGRNAGLLYVANTAGAGLGALAVPFWLLPSLGLMGALWLGAGLNLLLALGAWLLDRRWHGLGSDEHDSVDKSPGLIPVLQAGRSPPIALLAFLSGMFVFVLQVQWVRAFAQVHENSLYSFSTIVAAFIFALAAGGQTARVALGRGIAPEMLVCLGWLAGGLATAAGPALFLRLADGLAYLPREGGWGAYGFRLLLLATAVQFIPGMFLGMGLPAVMEWAGRRSPEAPTQVLGKLLAWNLAGAAGGALFAGFLLPGWLGLWKTIVCAALGLALAAAGVWLFSPAKRGLGVAVAVILCGGIASMLRMDLPRVRIQSGEGERLVAISEGVHGIVAVVERAQSRRLKLNNHYILGGTASAGDERMQAHIPLLLHPSPRRTAFLGLGTGITAGGGLLHPTESLTVVELVPEVVAAARESFREANGGVLEDFRTRIVVDDARSFLRGSPPPFDVIVGDLVVPWQQGESALFTLEHFTAARNALAPGGLFCQWIPMFQLGESELEILIRTFLSVFPRAWVWRGDFSPEAPAIALIGARESEPLDPGVTSRRLRELQPDRFNPQLAEPAVFWMHFVGVLEPQDLPGGETRISSENRPWIELLGPVRHAGQGRGRLCVGRTLQAWINGVKERSEGRLGALGPGEIAASQAGDLLFEFTLLLSEGRMREAEDVQSRLRAALGPSAFDAVFR